MGQSLPTTRNAPPPRDEDFESPHLLIVDDDPSVSRTLADFCVSRNWKATTARTADDAIMAIDAADAGDHPIDVVLSDVSLEQRAVEGTRGGGGRVPMASGQTSPQMPSSQPPAWIINTGAAPATAAAPAAVKRPAPAGPSRPSIELIEGAKRTRVEMVP